MTKRLVRNGYWIAGIFAVLLIAIGGLSSFTSVPVRDTASMSVLSTAGSGTNNLIQLILKPEPGMLQGAATIGPDGDIHRKNLRQYYAKITGLELQLTHTLNTWISEKGEHNQRYAYEVVYLKEDLSRFTLAAKELRALIEVVEAAQPLEDNPKYSTGGDRVYAVFKAYERALYDLYRTIGSLEVASFRTNG